MTLSSSSSRWWWLLLWGGNLTSHHVRITQAFTIDPLPQRSFLNYLPATQGERCQPTTSLLPRPPQHPRPTDISSARRRRQQQQPLAATLDRPPASSSSSFEDSFEDASKKTPTSSPIILLQKVLRIPGHQHEDPWEFVGHVVSYLQEEWTIPARLPMVYERQECLSDNHAADDPPVVVWDSPLSPDARATALACHVVVVDAAADAVSSVPSMVMVVVQRRHPQAAAVWNTKVPAMLQNLLADSERQLLQALDRSLNDLVDRHARRSIHRRRPTATSTSKQQIDSHSNNNNDKSDGETGATISSVEEFMQVFEREQRELQVRGEEPPINEEEKPPVQVHDPAVIGNDNDDNDDNDDNNNSPESSFSSSDPPILNAEILERHPASTTNTPNPTAAPAAASLKEQQQAAWDSMMATKTTTTTDDNNKTPPAVDFAVQQAAAAAAAAAAHHTHPHSPENTISFPTNNDKTRPPVDFAVQQAAAIAAAQHQKEAIATPTSGGEYAVQAAAAAAAARRRQKQEKQQEGTEKDTSDNDFVGKNTKEEGGSVAVNSDSGAEDPQSFMKGLRPPMLNDLTSSGRAFAQTISRPQDYQSRRNKEPQRQRRVKPIAFNKLETAAKRRHRREQLQANHQNNQKPTPPLSSSSKNPVPQGDTTTTQLESDKQINQTTDRSGAVKNVGAPSSETAVVGIENTSQTIPDASVLPKDFTTDRQVNIVEETEMDPFHKEMKEKAEEALDEIASAEGAEVSPEQLLENVLRFGDQQAKEERVGDGFVSGAFEKAKELLREQEKNRQARLQTKIAEQVSFDLQQPQRQGGAQPEPRVKDEERLPLSPEEELRRMFAAGEQFAEGQIAKTEHGSSDLSARSQGQTDAETVQALIDGNRDVSDYGRILDEELVELEVRLNKSPGEEFDGPPRNPQFDIMSGPEVYNRNVDPETAVNWPGAMPGTKQVRLPKQLNEAVSQAKFAADALSRLREEGPEENPRFFLGDREISSEQVANLRTVVKEAVGIRLIKDPLEVMAEASRLQMILDELWNQPEERFREIVSNYKDLLLSDSFVDLIRDRMNKMADRDLDALRRDDDTLEPVHARERELLGQLVVYAQLLLKEARALGAKLEAEQLEVIRSICKVAMDPTYRTEEETAIALTDAVRDMRPLFDDAFIAYLKYAVAEEEGRLARAGLVDDPEHNQWLYVLKIVQNGVYTELARGINRYIDHIWYVLRMETPAERRMLLKELIDVMPTLDVRPFVQVVENIAGALGDSVRGDFDGVMPLGEMTNKIMQLRRDVSELLPPERIAEKSKIADEWAAGKRKKLMKMRKETQLRLEGARQVEDRDQEVESLLRRGEVERFD